jgi:uncharacterized membrane protein YkvA (DUF1232 family)
MNVLSCPICRGTVSLLIEIHSPKNFVNADESDKIKRYNAKYNNQGVREDVFLLSNSKYSTMLILTLLATFLYIVLPYDLIPDYALPGIGWFDDVVVLAFFVYMWHLVAQKIRAQI